MVKQTPTIHLFYCANSVTEAELQELQSRLAVEELKSLCLPCSGKATIPYLLKAFEKGADGVVLCACPESQCKHLEGNLRASRRAEAVEGLLEEIGSGKGRIVVVTKEQGRIENLIEGIQQLQAALGRTMRSMSTGAPHGVTTSARARVRAGDRREDAA